METRQVEIGILTATDFCVPMTRRSGTAFGSLQVLLWPSGFGLKLMLVWKQIHSQPLVVRDSRRPPAWRRCDLERLRHCCHVLLPLYPWNLC